MPLQPKRRKSGKVFLFPKILSQLFQWVIWTDSKKEITGIWLAQCRVEIPVKGGIENIFYEVHDMHFIFGYQREAPVKVKRKTSKVVLVGLALLIILLLIFLSFENLEKDTSIPRTIFDPSPSLDKPNQPTQLEEIEFEKDRIFPEENAELILCQTKGGLK